jgi:hypothetical protein
MRIIDGASGGTRASSSNFIGGTGEGEGVCAWTDTRAGDNVESRKMAPKTFNSRCVAPLT